MINTAVWMSINHWAHMLVATGQMLPFVNDYCVTSLVKITHLQIKVVGSLLKIVGFDAYHMYANCQLFVHMLLLGILNKIPFTAKLSFEFYCFSQLVNHQLK